MNRLKSWVLSLFGAVFTMALLVLGLSGLLYSLSSYETRVNETPTSNSNTFRAQRLLLSHNATEYSTSCFTELLTLRNGYRTGDTVELEKRTFVLREMLHTCVDISHKTCDPECSCDGLDCPGQ